MSDLPKRRWFQIHLSTAVALMFVSGVLLWANLVPHKTVLYEGSHDGIKAWSLRYGWPTPYCSGHYFELPEGPSSVLSPEPRYSYAKIDNLRLNVFCAAVLLAVCAFACESTIRRREAHKP